MKVSTKHLTLMRDAIVPLDTPERRDDYRNGRFRRSETTKDLDMRYRWDLYWLAGGTKIWSELTYPDDYNDNHLDTALRSIVPKLTD